WLYWKQDRPRRAVDAIFFEAMGVLGVGAVARHTLYWGVRLFGWLAWYRNRAERLSAFDRVLPDVHLKSIARSERSGMLRQLTRQIELGHGQQVTAEAPRFHGTEDCRWDYRVTIVWKNAAAPHEAFPDAELKRLFPDQDTFRREEQRRFEILAAHWDLPVVSV